MYLAKLNTQNFFCSFNNINSGGRKSEIKMKYLLTILILAFSCAGPYMPDERGIEVIEDSEGLGVAYQSKAMFQAQYLVEDHYRTDFGDLSTEATVYWTDTLCPKNGEYAVIYDHGCSYGIMWSCDEMYVALSNKDPKRTCGSALIHEFGHCMYMKMFGYRNSEHNDDEFWEVIGDAQKSACDRGW
jgi:hypothetical protein